MPLFSFSQSTLEVSEEGITGFYEGVVKRDYYKGPKNKVEILLYKPSAFHRSYRAPKALEYIYGMRKQYPDKKGKGIPDTTFFFGIINSNSTTAEKIQLNGVKFFKPGKGGLEKIRGLNSFSIKILDDEEILVYDLAYGTNLKKEKGNGETISRMVIDFFAFRLSQCENQSGVLIGQRKPIYSGYNRTPQSGLDILTFNKDAKSVVTAEELEVFYQTKILFPQKETSFSVAKFLLKPALLLGSCIQELPLNLMPFLRRISVYSPETGEKHFEVSIIRNRNSLQIGVEVTPEGKAFAKMQEEELSRRNQLEEKKKERANLAKLEAEKAGGINPSGETIDFSGTANSVVSEIKKVFYGKFDQVNEFMFKNRMHNSFLIYASSLYGQYSSDLISVSFSIEEEKKNGWGVTNKRTLDYKVWVEPRFEKSFNEYLQTLQLSRLNAFSWGATLEYFFKKYPPDSIVFKQLKENIYRFSKGLPPVDDLNDIH